SLERWWMTHRQSALKAPGLAGLGPHRVQPTHRSEGPASPPAAGVAVRSRARRFHPGGGENGAGERRRPEAGYFGITSEPDPPWAAPGALAAPSSPSRTVGYSGGSSRRLSTKIGTSAARVSSASGPGATRRIS